MPKNPPPNDPTEVQVAIPLGEWMTAMMDRDNQMWEQLNNRDDRVLGEVLKLVSQVIEANSIDHVVARGFDEASKQIGEYIAPLRPVGRDYGAPGEGVNERLVILNRALERQNFSSDNKENPIRHNDDGDTQGKRSYAS
jgi:hypothetical protein